ncbi:hypothetical protein TRFO_30983 [Tritrichomonas foetus]|uniref:Uncharacterized protein n=1 Tax=Tritrichomonas foetus TaxID=1144522 RepID=A0A1J4JSA4_9EUKA|nr:hypothetical protein TRFO_30983 [Tritrichomonas foetus]|eukprot:OHT02023.1 hypothetical protein TRFO_30983 [Tritrichomonas foetus]
MLEHDPLSPLVKISYCIFPFVLNVAFFLFIGFSITPTLIPKEVPNAIALTDCFFIYVIDCIIMFIYGKCMGTWSELFYGVDDNIFLVIILISTFPVFFLFFLPYLMFSLMKNYIGSPYAIWERVFGMGGASLKNLKCDGDAGLAIFGRYIYIGFPFIIFSLVYLIIFLALAPLWYFVFSPFGMTMYSVCLAVSFNSDEVRASTINDRVDQTYRWGMFLNVYGIDLLAFLSSACYVGLYQFDWKSGFLLIVSVLYFAAFSIPSVYKLFCSDQPLFDFP